ncbi:kinesin-like protein KIF3A [Schistocerca gregaria]|uniref:kinesin-like protein KIF3A n=1 Tax=Schistocerca gregaria TaxID=7010 RepID=UPI00211E6918|nr:kinesin-like protein KIF3A [Schistocerca gregaria]
MVRSCLDGYHGCIFAYGQTGSGKTYTIYGGRAGSEKMRSEERGLVFRVIEYLFAKIAQSKNEYSCKCSYLEIYQEKIKDLLASDRQAKNLFIREDLKRDVYVEHLKEVAIDSEEDVEELLSYGAQRRHVARTAANDQSSRSHTVFTLYVEGKILKEGGMKVRRYASLHLVDLAGSERQKSTEATSLRLKEASVINQSLTTLGRVIRSLAQGGSNYVHYRDSKLTFLLKNSLGGNSKTSIIVTIDPHMRSYEESLSTLKFAQRAKFIRNRASINENVLRSVGRQQEVVRKSARREVPSSVEHRSGGAEGAVGEGLREGVEASSSEGCQIVKLEASLRDMRQREEKMKAEQIRCYEKIEDMQLLCLRQKLYFRVLECCLELSEDRTRRILEYEGGSAYKEELYGEELRNLEKQIGYLKYQLDHHPQVTRLAIENMELREVLDQYVEVCSEESQELGRLRELQGRLASEVERLIGEKHRLIECLCKGEEGGCGVSGLEEWKRGERMALEMELEEYKCRAGEELSAMRDSMAMLERDWDVSRDQLGKLVEMMRRHEVEHEKEMKAMRAKHEEEVRALKTRCDEQTEDMEAIRRSEKSTLAIVLTMEQQIDRLSEENSGLKDYIEKLKAEYQSERLKCGAVGAAEVERSEDEDELAKVVGRCGEGSLAGLTDLTGSLLQVLEKTLLKHHRVIVELQSEVCRIKKEKETMRAEVGGRDQGVDEAVSNFSKKFVNLGEVKSDIERVTDEVATCESELSDERIGMYTDLLERVAVGELGDVRVADTTESNADRPVTRGKKMAPLLEAVLERLGQRKQVTGGLECEAEEMMGGRTEVLNQLTKRKRPCENTEHVIDSLRTDFEPWKCQGDGNDGDDASQDSGSQRGSEGDCPDSSDEKGSCDDLVFEEGKNHSRGQPDGSVSVAGDGPFSCTNERMDAGYSEGGESSQRGVGFARCMSDITNRRKRSFSPGVESQSKKGCTTWM